MTTPTYSSYEEAAQDYLAKFQALREAAPASRDVTTRGAGDVPVETLIERADEIAEVSARMIPLAKDYLEAPDPTLREGISGQLLAQAAAELQVATELLQVAAEQAGGAGEPEMGTRDVTRAASGANLQEAIDTMEQAMAVPVSAGLLAPDMAQRGEIGASSLEGAKQALQQAVAVTTIAISQRVVEVGSDLAFNLVFKTQWNAVIQSAGLINKDIANLLDKVKEGASKLIQGAINGAMKTLLNVYDKILALLGKDLEDQARQKVRNWLEDIQKEGKIELFEQLVGKLYQVEAFQAVMPGWLEKTTVGLDKLNATTADVAALSDKFTALVGRINSVGDVLGLARFIQVQFPQVLVIVTAIQVSLLAILVYGGYDYIGFNQAKLLNLTKGVTEVVRENLAV